jgi:ASPIC and UnbV/FG-GAP-like repeat
MIRTLVAAGPILATITALMIADVSPGGRWFTEVTHQAGIRHRHSNRAFNNPYAKIMAGYTALGASVAVADFDRDGFDDFFLTDSSENGKNRLYRNRHNFTFTDVAEDAGVAEGNDPENASAAALWLDFNNDGWPDLLVIRFGHNQLFENLGNGHFMEVTKQAGLDRYLNSIAATAFDYDHDGYVDLLIGAYFQAVNLFQPNTPHFFPESFEAANNGGGVVLFHNNGNGTFSDVTEKAGLKQSGWTLSLGHGDADNDGWDDLYIACDFGTDRLFHNQRDGTFKDITESAIGFDTKKGMNVDWGDFDNDGLLDIYVTNITDDYMREGNFLWRNNGNLTFSDVSRETGTYDTGWGWGAKFFDYDNDGWLDLYVLNGWVSAGKESYVPDIFAMITRPGVDLTDARNWPPLGSKSLSGYQRKRLFHNDRGAMFRDDARRHGLDSQLDGRGVGVADFDNDGRQDLIIANANSEPLLYRNVMPLGPRWIEFLLEGKRSNRAAVGAQIRITVDGKQRLGFVNGGSSFAGQSSQRVHFGLGASTAVEKAEIRWPSGLVETYRKLEINCLHRIHEGDSREKP